MEPSPGRCKDHQFQESEQIRSLVFLWVCKRASQSTAVFSVSGIVELYPSITSRKTGCLEALLFLVEHSLKENPLVDVNKVLLPPLHIKLGLMKNFVKALHKNGAVFQHLSIVFPGLSVAKLKEGIFVGPQIREVLKDTDFEELLNLNELRVWEAFKSVCSGFLGNTRVPDYQACIEKLLKSYKDMGCRMSLKIPFLHSHLNFFPPNIGAVSDEHEERFQDITKMESNYQGKWETSAGCSCVTSRRQNTPDLLRKYTFDCVWYYELRNCVIQVY